MFAIVDIETTGGSPGRDRITEICILIHDGLTVVEKFSTLINPERRIPEYITRMTGISNEMVEDAPKFYEVAKKIIELTDEKIFVAHNVNFDYNFIHNEYKSLGYSWKREKLCTVRLSRKLLPRRVSYSLGKLCASLGIEIEARHRAAGDAEATAKLFDILLSKKSEHPVYRRHDIAEINTSRVDKIKLYILKKLPEACGVYYFLDKDGNIIYIGKSTNMRQRAIGHFNSREEKSGRMQNEMMNVDFVKTGSELIALLLESEEIKKHKPKFNRARKQSVFSHSIDYFTCEKGILNFRIVEYDEAKHPLLSYASYTSARERLNAWMDEYALCLNYCGLNDDGGECFHRHVKKCFGICTGEEDVESYNVRAEKIIAELSFPDKNFLLLGAGRTDEENSIVLVENGHYAGYGFIDRSESIHAPEEMKGFVRPAAWFPDADELVRGWMRKKNNLEVIRM